VEKRKISPFSDMEPDFSELHRIADYVFSIVPQPTMLFAHIDFYNEAHTLGLVFTRTRTNSPKIPTEQKRTPASENGSKETQRRLL
jgi:hypothetical protein